MDDTLNHEEKLLRDTLLNLLEIFQGDTLSDETEEGLVRTIEGLRSDFRSRIRDREFWEELDVRLSGMPREHRRRFEHLVSERLLSAIPRRTAAK